MNEAASTDPAQTALAAPTPTAAPAAKARPAADLSTFLIGSEWVFILAVIALVIAFKSYSPLMNVGIGLWAGTWVARWLRTGRPTRATPLDLPLLGFGVSVLIAAWIAPDLSDALDRLALFVAAIGLFYVLVNSSPRGLQLFGWGFLIAATIFGLYFASEHPWETEPAKLATFQRIGVWLNHHVPSFLIYDPHPNVVGGLLAIACAIWLGLAWQGWAVWRTGKGWTWLGLLGMLILGAALGFGLLMTQSRASWLAATGAGMLGVAWLVSGRLGRWLRLPQWAVFWIGCGFVAGLALGVVISKPHLVSTVLGTLPGPNSAVSRVEIYKQVWSLAQDTPYTGAGLGAFPGVYSTFVLSIPSLYLTHAHNIWLNLLVEQGWLGAGAYTLALGLTAWFGLIRLTTLKVAHRAVVAAGLLGLAALTFNGLADATLVASRVAPALLIPAGLALGGQVADEFAWRPTRWGWVSALALVALVAVAGVLFYQPLAAQWHANWGAVAQDRVVLANGLTSQWSETDLTEALQPAQQEYEAALALQPDNQTALYRTGLIALSALNFQTAAERLQQVYDVAPTHRGVIKNLGYAYAWSGKFDQATQLLITLPESQDELTIYAWWWLNRRGREDLAKNALTVLGRMH